eukprot:evm.model.NODE_13667_length_9612_cov_17.590200.1
MFLKDLSATNRTWVFDTTQNLFLPKAFATVKNGDKLRFGPVSATLTLPARDEQHQATVAAAEAAHQQSQQQQQQPQHQRTEEDTAAEVAGGNQFGFALPLPGARPAAAAAAAAAF